MSENTRVKWKPARMAVATAALIAGLAMGAAIVPALAAQDPVLTEEQQQTLQSQVDAYKACIEQQGVTLPEKSADGTKPELTDEQREAIKAARDACADQRPSRPELSDEQRAQLQAQAQEHRACMEAELSAAGITRPEKPAEGTRPADGARPARPELTDEQKAAMEAARTACEDLRPNLGVEGGPLLGHGPGGRGGPGGPMGRPGGAPGDSQGSQGSTQQTSSAV